MSAAILILSNPRDPHTDLVIDRLRAKGAETIRLNLAEFPQQTQLGMRLQNEGSTLRFCDQTGSSDLEKVRTVWLRRMSKPEINMSDVRRATGVRADAMGTLASLWDILRDRFWINSMEHDRAAHHKPVQLAAAQRAGLEIPPTIITNRPEDAQEFFRSVEHVVYKALEPYSHVADALRIGIYTNVVSSDVLSRRVGDVQFAPCLFQEAIERIADVRVTVVGNQMFPVAIRARTAATRPIDWRKAMDDAILSPCDLPADVAARIRVFMRDLGLVFGCLDFIQRPDGQLVFLEVNPTGQWYWVEQATGLPILETFTDLLIRGSV